MNILLLIIIAIILLAILLYSLVKFNVIDLYDFCGEEERRNKFIYYFPSPVYGTDKIERVNLGSISEHTYVDRGGFLKYRLYISRKQHEDYIKSL